MVTYAWNSDGAAHGKQSPLSSTSNVYDHYITQYTGYTSTIFVSCSCDADNQINTGIDIHKIYNVPQRKDTDMLSCFNTSGHDALLCSAGTQTAELCLFRFKHTK